MKFYIKFIEGEGDMQKSYIDISGAKDLQKKVDEHLRNCDLCKINKSQCDEFQGLVNKNPGPINVYLLNDEQQDKIDKHFEHCSVCKLDESKCNEFRLMLNP